MSHTSCQSSAGSVFRVTNDDTNYRTDFNSSVSSNIIQSFDAGTLLTRLDSQLYFDKNTLTSTRAFIRVSPYGSNPLNLTGYVAYYDTNTQASIRQFLQENDIQDNPYYTPATSTCQCIPFNGCVPFNPCNPCLFRC